MFLILVVVIATYVFQQIGIRSKSICASINCTPIGSLPTVGKLVPRQVVFRAEGLVAAVARTRKWFHSCMFAHVGIEFPSFIVGCQTVGE